MDDSAIKILEQEIKDIMRPTKELAHGEETLAWLFKIEPHAPWQLQIAALAHDIERALPNELAGVSKQPIRKDFQTYDEFKQAHALRSAQVVQTLMQKLAFPSSDIDRVTNAITKHEVGGDLDSDLVRDADSIRWFDSGYTKYIQAFGIESAKEKGWWMYKRAIVQTKLLIDKLPFDKNVKNYIKQQSLEYKTD